MTTATIQADVRRNATTELWEVFHNGSRMCECRSEREAQDVLAAYHYDLTTSGQIYTPAAPPATNGPVRVELLLCEDTLDPDRYGKVIGTRYFAGDQDTDAEVEIFIPVETDDVNFTQLFMLHGDGLDVEDIRQVLPSLITLFNDSMVAAALAADAARSRAA